MRARTFAVLFGCSALCAPCLAQVQLRVTVENLAPTNSVAFAPLRIGFNAGTFDAFNEGELATAPIVSIAEGGSGSAWFPAFAAADTTATLGTVAPDPAGPLVPGASASAEFTVDPSVNRYFTFAAMVVPSNDYFIGNDPPMQYELFDASGNLNITSITEHGSDVWDAGSEVDGIFGAAFLQESNNDDRIPDNQPVAHDFMDLDIFNGHVTAAGYTFDRQFGADDAIYRISFAVVPAPGAVALLGIGALLPLRRRR